MLRRMLLALLCGALIISFVGSTLAVEKKGKDKASVVKKATKAKQGTSKKAVTAKKNDSAAAAVNAKKAAPKYDKFVDLNKNGIDDRKEKLVSKSKSKPKAQADSTKKQVKKTSSKKKETKK